MVERHSEKKRSVLELNCNECLTYCCYQINPITKLDQMKFVIFVTFAVGKISPGDQLKFSYLADD